MAKKKRRKTPRRLTPKDEEVLRKRCRRLIEIAREYEDRMDLKVAAMSLREAEEKGTVSWDSLRPGDVTLEEIERRPEKRRILYRYDLKLSVPWEAVNMHWDHYDGWSVIIHGVPEHMQHLLKGDLLIGQDWSGATNPHLSNWGGR